MKNKKILKPLLFAIKKRDLLRQIVVSKLVSGQKDLILGYLWWILEPLLLTLVYWLLVKVIFQRGGPNYPLFVLCGLVPYRAFAVSFGQSTAAISSKFGLIGQLNFPRLFLPMSDVFVNHVKLVFGFIVIIIFALIFKTNLNYTIIFLAVPFMIQIVLVIGLAMIMSILGVYFRDLRNLMQFIMRILLYLSPVLYSIDRIPERFQDLYLLNPIATLILSYRDIILNGSFPNPKYLFIASLEALFLLFVGYLFFSSREQKILKYI